MRNTGKGKREDRGSSFCLLFNSSFPGFLSVCARGEGTGEKIFEFGNVLELTRTTGESIYSEEHFVSVAQIDRSTKWEKAVKTAVQLRFVVDGNTWGNLHIFDWLWAFCFAFYSFD